MNWGARANTFCISSTGPGPVPVLGGRYAIVRTIWRTMLVLSPVREIPMNVTGRLRVERMVLINLRTCSKAKGRCSRSDPCTTQNCKAAPRMLAPITMNMQVHGQRPSTASFQPLGNFHSTMSRCETPCTHPQVN
jgi:hypothetical protein